MELEIRDTQSSESMTIPATGRTLGREGSESADLTVPDRTVSSRHAKIFARGSCWYIEDLRSSNGTFVNGERITVPTQLTAGDRFSLCRYGFEVVRVLGGFGPNTTAVLGNTLLTGRDSSTNLRVVPSYRAEERQPAASAGNAPESEFGPLAADPGSTEKRGPAGNSAAAAAPSTGDSFLSLVLMAVGYYVAAIPMLLLNPFRFVRNGIANQRFGAFGPAELIAYAVPALAVGAALSILSTTIFRLVWGEIGIDLVTRTLFLLGGCAAGAAITGLGFHPLLRRFVRLLEGGSTAESRSNFFVMLYTGAILVFVPPAVVDFVGLVPEPLVAAVPMVLALAAYLLIAFIAYSWFRHFQVLSWFPILLILVGGLLCVMTAKDLVGLVRLRIAGGGVATADAASGVEAGNGEADAAARIAELQKVLRDAVANGANAEEIAAWERELQGLQLAAAEGDAGEETSRAAAEELAGARADAAKSAGLAMVGPNEPSTDYESFLRKRQAVEDALERDPTLLKRQGAEALYKELHRIAYRVKQKHKVKIGKRITAERIAQQKVAEKLRDAEIYEESSRLVDELYEKIVERR
jgi:hypothetical protein